jgi:metallo-beta-lactamase family protein
LHHHFCQWYGYWRTGAASPLPSTTSKKKTLSFLSAFQAVGTRGRRLLDGEKSVKIFGQEVEVKARIERIYGLSAHADRSELFDWLDNFEDAPKVHVHRPRRAGECHGFAQAIKERLDWYNVEVPDYLDSETLFWKI